MIMGGRVFSTNSSAILNEQMVMHWSQNDIGSMLLMHRIKTTAYDHVESNEKLRFSSKPSLWRYAPHALYTYFFFWLDLRWLFKTPGS